ncbi:hypothetical protein Vadar_028797 [Vaccinium darrowii]|uniref:Uncharacterized protein n=1 Tax=Vaccinium darrowii TaxID=229202 RepID=A0ACB7XUQ2_9ERIC|nr:hypothetical protein Vadar_028797 [Vaccinium darrowii]
MEREKRRNPEIRWWWWRVLWSAVGGLGVERGGGGGGGDGRTALPAVGALVVELIQRGCRERDRHWGGAGIRSVTMNLLLQLGAKQYQPAFGLRYRVGLFINQSINNAQTNLSSILFIPISSTFMFWGFGGKMGVWKQRRVLYQELKLGFVQLGFVQIHAVKSLGELKVDEMGLGCLSSSD